MKKIVGGLLILIGVAFIAYPSIMAHIVRPHFLEIRHQEALDINQEEISLNRERIEENRASESYQESSPFDYEAVEYLSYGYDNVSFDHDGVIGVIQIPSVELELPIFYGTTNEVLEIGAGTMKPEQQMGRGNYALAGHNSRNPELYFAPIRELQEGAVIYVTDKETVYKYTKTQKKVVNPDAIHVLEDMEDRELITLISCTSDGSKRLVVQGKLKAEFPFEDHN